MVDDLIYRPRETDPGAVAIPKEKKRQGEL
jgi:hypothetical protein